MTNEAEIKKRLVAHGVASLDGTYVHASMDEVLKALAPAPDAGLVEREELKGAIESGLMMFDAKNYWRDRAIAAEAALLSSRAVAGEPVADLERIAKSLASMLIDYVEGGINCNQNWRNGLDVIIEARLRRFIAPAPSGRDSAEAAEDDDGHDALEYAVGMLRVIVAGKYKCTPSQLSAFAQTGLDLVEKHRHASGRDPATIEAAYACVPSDWRDPLLTGEAAPGMPPFSKPVEALLRGIQDRIRALAEPAIVTEKR